MVACLTTLKARYTNFRGDAFIIVQPEYIISIEPRKLGFPYKGFYLLQNPDLPKKGDNREGEGSEDFCKSEQKGYRVKDLKSELLCTKGCSDLTTRRR